MSKDKLHGITMAVASIGRQIIQLLLFLHLYDHLLTLHLCLTHSLPHACSHSNMSAIDIYTCGFQVPGRYYPE